MGVSGIRKDPDALLRVESTPTPFRVVSNLKSNRRPLMANTYPPRSAGISGAQRRPHVSLHLAAYRARFPLAHRLAFGVKGVCHG